MFFLKINNIADKISFNRQEAHNEFEKACEDSYQKNIRYLLSQYYLGPMLLLLFNVFILVLFTMMCYGYTFGFEFEDAINSVVIMQYIMYFITTLVVIPTLIERWPRAYASSVRLEEVLVLEDKITEKKNKNFKEIKIEKEDIYDLNKRILVDRKEIAHKFNRVLNHHRTKIIISMILLTVSTLCIVYAPKVTGNIINSITANTGTTYDHEILRNINLLFILCAGVICLRCFQTELCSSLENK